MATIRFRKLQNDPQKVAFNCGNSGINDMVRRSYYPTILQHVYAFEILVGDTIVGYYMLGFKKMVLTDCPGEVGDYISDMSEFCYSLHIRYIAIAQEYQHRGIGSNALRLLIYQVQKLCDVWPVRLITLDALKERVEWYKSIGFIMFNERDLNSASKKIEMYLDCLIEQEKLKQYTSGSLGI